MQISEPQTLDKLKQPNLKGLMGFTGFIGLLGLSALLDIKGRDWL